MFKSLNATALGLSGHQSEIIELALTYNFRGIDMRIDEMAQRVKQHGLAYARRLVDSAGVTLSAFPLPLDWEAEESDFNAGLATLAEQADVAQQIGCTRSVSEVAPASDVRPYHENFELHRRRLAQACQVLGERGVRLGVAFRATAEHRRDKSFEFIHGFDALHMLIGMAGAANLGIVIDAWEMEASGATVDSLQKLSAEQVVAVRVADGPAEGAPESWTDNDRLLPGATGRIDLAAYLRALAEMGYDGPVTPLPARHAVEGQRRDAAVRSLADALAGVWHAAGLSSDDRLSAAAGR